MITIYLLASLIWEEIRTENRMKISAASPKILLFICRKIAILLSHFKGYSVWRWNFMQIFLYKYCIFRWYWFNNMFHFTQEERDIREMTQFWYFQFFIVDGNFRQMKCPFRHKLWLQMLCFVCKSMIWKWSIMKWEAFLYHGNQLKLNMHICLNLNVSS